MRGRHRNKWLGVNLSIIKSPLQLLVKISKHGPTKKIMVLVGRDALHLNQKRIHFGDPSI